MSLIGACIFYEISYLAISTKTESAQNWSQRLLLCRYCNIHSHALFIWIIDSMLFCSPNFRVLNSSPPSPSPSPTPSRLLDAGSSRNIIYLSTNQAVPFIMLFIKHAFIFTFVWSFHITNINPYICVCVYCMKDHVYALVLNKRC